MRQEFKMVESGTPSHLEEGVNELLAEGWSLHGVPMHAATPVDDGTTVHRFVQALVRDADE